MAHPHSRRVASVLAFVLGFALLASGCGGGSDKAKAENPADVMKTAKKHLDDASSVHIALSTDSTPTSGNGVLGATGDLTHAPAFRGEVKVVLSGLTATVPVTSVDNKVHAKLPLQTKYSVINPSEYGAPDPADFVDPDIGVSSLLTQLDGLKKSGEVRSGDKVLTTYTGTLPGAAVKKVIPSAEAGQTYKTRIGVDAKGYARTVQVTGTFFTGNDDVTYDVLLSAYDQDVQITAPPS
jgi:lipoprotein LprG